VNTRFGVLDQFTPIVVALENFYSWELGMIQTIQF